MFCILSFMDKIQAGFSSRLSSIHYIHFSLIFKYKILYTKSILNERSFHQICFIFHLFFLHSHRILLQSLILLHIRNHLWNTKSSIFNCSFASSTYSFAFSTIDSFSSSEIFLTTFAGFPKQSEPASITLFCVTNAPAPIIQ